MLVPEGINAIKEKFPSITDQPALGIEGEYRESVPALVVEKEDILPLCRFLKEDPALSFDYLINITGVDYSAWPHEESKPSSRITVVYHLYSMEHKHKLVLRANLPAEAPSIDSVVEVWSTADWLERETYDLVGIEFNGHPHLRRILLPGDWEGHPLLKDYSREPDKYD